MTEQSSADGVHDGQRSPTGADVRDARRPLFTVVMPLFNKARHLDATLASIASQRFDDYEVVVVDDGSTDDGPARVERAGGRVRLLRQANAGPGMARNRGIAAARGAWVAFLDADDLWHPDHLATLAQTIEECPDADVVATGFARGTGPRVIPEHDPVARGEARYIDYFDEYGLVWTSAVAVRATALDDERFGCRWPGEDMDLWARLSVDRHYAVHPAVTAIYVQDTGGAMDSQHSGSAAAIADQPVFITLDAILADPRLIERHAAAARFRDALLLDYTRPALFSGHTALARDYLRTLRRHGRPAPLLYRGLAHLPGPVARAGSRAYGAIKRALGR